MYTVHRTPYTAPEVLVLRLRRIEFIAIALTFAFVCFIGGYFAGSKGSVSIVAVEPQNGETQHFSTVEMAGAASSTAQNTVQGALPSAIDAADAPQNTEKIPAPSVTAAGSNDDEAVAAEGSPSPAAQQAGEAVGAPRGGDGRININSASRTELMDLPGIGDVLSGRIVDYRNQYGAFSNIEDIKRVSGIGDKKFEAIRDKITVN